MFVVAIISFLPLLSRPLPVLLFLLLPSACIISLFLHPVSWDPGWCQTCDILETGFELLVLVSPSPKYYDFGESKSPF